MLVSIKLLHTAVWLFFVACIIGLPIAAMVHQFRWAGALAGLVLVECAVLAVNRCRCPLTGLAGRYTNDRSDNFDIYLPMWLARRNNEIFGAIFAIGGVIAVWQWLVAPR